ncbi:MAG: TRAP transporter small permease [Bacillota bacterium]
MEKSGFNKFCDYLEQITLYLAAAILVVMLLVAWVHVIRRYIFNNALSWSEEFLRYALIWFAALSASILHKRRGHLGITIFREMMPKGLQHVLERIIPYLAVLVMTLGTVFGLQLTVNNASQITPALRVSIAFPYAALPLSFFLMTIYSVKHIIDDATGYQDAGIAPKEDEP